MPRIRCHYLDCVFLDDGYCSAAAIELDPDTGCLTYSQSTELLDPEWVGEEELEEDWDELGFEEEEEEDDDLWLEDEEEEVEEEDEDF